MIGGWLLFGALVALGFYRQSSQNVRARRAAELEAERLKENPPCCPCAAKRPVGRPRRTPAVPAVKP